MLTTPITNSHFHSRVLSLLSSHLSSSPSNNEPHPVIPPLTAADTSLVPNGSIPQLVALSSSWIDLCSSDPCIASLSQQVLCMEIAYSSFCGFSNVMISGPNLFRGAYRTSGLAQYARAVKETLDIGSYLQISISLTMVDDPDLDMEEPVGSLASFAREEFADTGDEEQLTKADLFGSWDAWHIIRTICNYSPRLFVGKNQNHYTFSISILLLD